MFKRRGARQALGNCAKGRGGLNPRTQKDRALGHVCAFRPPVSMELGIWCGHPSTVYPSQSSAHIAIRGRNYTHFLRVALELRSRLFPVLSAF